MTSKLRSLAALKGILQRERKRGHRIVFTNGCFDILHLGHTHSLEAARRMGDYLVVGLNSDDAVRRLKGHERPLNSQKNRAGVLSALACVDAIVLFTEDTPIQLIRAVKPDVLVKGGDWKKKDVVGGAWVESYGGKVRLIPTLRGFSTTTLLKKIKAL